MRYLVLLGLGLLLVSRSAQSQTNVTDSITTATTWTVAGSPYILQNSISVYAPLTVQPGVTVNLGSYGMTFGYYSSYNPDHPGYLIADGVMFEGSGANLIMRYDGAGGSVITNSTFSGTVLTMYLRSSGAIQNCEFDGAGVISFCIHNEGGMWTLSGGSVHDALQSGIHGKEYYDGSYAFGSLSIDSCQIYDNVQYGIDLQNVHGDITNCTIRNHEYPMRLVGGIHDLSGCNLMSNAHPTLDVSGGILIATVWDSTWPLPIALTRSMSVYSSLTVEPDVVVPLGAYSMTFGIELSYDPDRPGWLNATGATFTGTTGSLVFQCDGASSSSITDCSFVGVSIDCTTLTNGTITNCTFDANSRPYGVLVSGGAWTMQGGAIRNATAAGIYGTSGRLDVTGVSIQDNGIYGLQMVNTSGDVTNCSISGHTYAYSFVGGAHVLTGNDDEANTQAVIPVFGTMTAASTWRSDWGMPIVLTNSLTVECALTIEPGVSVDLGTRNMTFGRERSYDPDLPGWLNATGATFTGTTGSLVFQCDGASSSIITDCSFVGVSIDCTTLTDGTVSGSDFDANGQLYAMRISGGNWMAIDSSFARATSNNVLVTSGAVVLEGCIASDAGLYGVNVAASGATCTLRNVRLVGGASGLYVNSGASASIDGSDIVCGGVHGVYYSGAGAPLIARNNYWGDARGPSSPLNIYGRGSAAGPNVDFSNFSATPFWRSGGDVRGIVYADQNGNSQWDAGIDIPISGATVSLNSRASVSTGADGKFRITADAGGANQQLVISGRSYRTKTITNVTVPATGEIEVNIALAPLDADDLLLVDLRPAPINGASKSGPDATIHRYYRLIDSVSGDPAAGYEVWYSRNGVPMGMCVSDAEGVVDVAITTSSIQNGDDISIYAIASMELPPIMRKTFTCIIDSQWAPMEVVHRASGSVGLGFHFVRLDADEGTVATLLDTDATRAGPETLRIEREFRVAAGARASASYPPAPKRATGSVSAQIGVSAEVKGYLQDDDEFEFAWPPASPEAAQAMYGLLVSANIENVSDNMRQVLQRGLLPFFGDSSVLEEWYRGDGTTLGWRAGAGITGDVGLDGATAPVNAAIQVGVRGEAGGAVGTSYRSPVFRVDRNSLSLLGSFDFAAGFGMSPGSRGAARQGSKDAQDAFLGVGTNAINRFVAQTYRQSLVGNDLVAELGFERQHETADKISTVRFWTQHPTLIAAIEAAGCGTVEIADLLVSGGSAFQLNTSDYLNDIVIASDEIIATQERPLSQVGYDGQDAVLHYVMETEVQSEVPAVGLDLDFGNLSFTLEPKAIKTTGAKSVVERGAWVLGRPYPLETYEEPNLTGALSYQDVLQAICDALPPSLEEDSFEWCPIGGATAGKAIYVLPDNRSTLDVPVDVLPAGVQASAYYWSWYSAATSAPPAKQADARAVAEWVKGKAEAAAGMRYGIGGFHQLEPLGTQLNGQATLALCYADSDVVGFCESDLGVYYEDKAHARYVYVPAAQVDTVANRVTVPISQFRMYTLAPHMPHGAIPMTVEPQIIAADGVAVATVQAGPLLNSDGSQVSNGTLFTISAANGQIDTPDADLNTDGTQIAAQGGLLTYTVRAGLVASPSVLEVRSVDGSAAGRDTLLFADVDEPLPPTGLQAVDRGLTSVELVWNRSPEADVSGYKIYFDTDSPQPPYTGQVAYLALPSPIDAQSDTSLTVIGLDPMTSYYFRVTAYDVVGKESDYSAVILDVRTSPVDVDVPAAFGLEQNYPNPFNPKTTIKYSVPSPGRVSLRIYDVRGRLVRTLVDADMPAGGHETVWHAEDDAGRRVASGVYLYLLQTKQETRTRKMVVVR